MESNPFTNVQAFLTSRAGFKQLVSREKFSKVLSSIDSTMTEVAIQDLYEALAIQNNKRLKDVNYTLKNEMKTTRAGRDSMRLDVSHSNADPGKVNDNSLLEDTGRDTLESIFKDLEKLNDNIFKDKTEAQNKAAEVLKEINDRIDDLSDLRYGRLDFMSSITESYQSLDKLEQKLLPKIE